MAHNCSSLTFSTKNGVIPIDETWKFKINWLVCLWLTLSNIVPYYILTVILRNTQRAHSFLWPSMHFLLWSPRSLLSNNLLHSCHFSSLYILDWTPMELKEQKPFCFHEWKYLNFLRINLFFTEIRVWNLYSILPSLAQVLPLKWC